MIFTGWDTPLTLLRMELIQRDYEGHTVPEGLKEQIAALDDERDAMNFEAVDTLYRALEKVPKDGAFGYVQPNDLEGIREERPDGPRQLGPYCPGRPPGQISWCLDRACRRLRPGQTG